MFNSTSKEFITKLVVSSGFIKTTFTLSTIFQSKSCIMKLNICSRKRSWLHTSFSLQICIWIFVGWATSWSQYCVCVNKCRCKANLKKIVCFLSPASQKKKKKSPGRPVKLFSFFKLNITFYFKYYLHHLNWNNTQIYSSTKPLHNVPSSVFWFVNYCFLPFLRRTSVQKWKKTGSVIGGWRGLRFSYVTAVVETH